MDELHEAKWQWRRKIADLKKACPTETLHALSTTICRRLEKMPLFRQAKSIAAYYALEGEVQTAGFIEYWRSEKKIFLPVTEGDKLRLAPYTGRKSLREGAFHIMEPAAAELSPEMPEIDLMIVPGLAFDRQRNRLGRGKGLYDRLLSEFSVITVGICFDFQLFDRIPAGTDDRKMDWIITENEIIC
ncbi:MAG: 5-formyltetrahydrofolate cyclo-ligase [Tannerella sp.]|jgi:5-formyltetrahydrofolate cyclo-ligase|nr:5-formyltetrahydrofolate cyclo-ligase [Tannerella sp.]